MKLLGLRLCEHDSNISYFDGESVHYLKTERLYNEKHHAYNNLWQWKSDLKILNTNIEDIDEIAIVIDPWVHKLPSINEEFFPAIDYNIFSDKSKVFRVNHHLAHALSCWPLYDERPKYEIIIDGFGDENNAWTVIKENKIFKRGYYNLNGSLGSCMGGAAKFCNIQAFHEQDLAGKLMGLQSYGKIDYNFRNKLNFDMMTINHLFNFENYINHKGDKTLAILTPLDWIKTVHDKVSDILIEFFEEVTMKNYNAHISYSGGVAQNVIWNTSIKNKFNNLIIPPHCGDEGLSLGALEFLRTKNKLPKFKLDNFPFCQSDECPEKNADEITIKKTAQYLKEGKTVAWYQGNGEIGPRALGNRSLLFNPIFPNGRNIINKIKNRENYRPFGASILKEYLSLYINGPKDNKHMLFVGNLIHKNLDSIKHVDGTCRYQVVDKTNLIFYNLIEEFNKLTDCPILLNTSLNINGKPIMSKLEDALSYFNQSDIDILVLGNKIYTK